MLPLDAVHVWDLITLILFFWAFLNLLIPEISGCLFLYLEIISWEPFILSASHLACVLSRAREIAVLNWGAILTRGEVGQRTVLNMSSSTSLYNLQATCGQLPMMRNEHTDLYHQHIPKKSVSVCLWLENRSSTSDVCSWDLVTYSRCCVDRNNNTFTAGDNGNNNWFSSFDVLSRAPPNVE